MTACSDAAEGACMMSPKAGAILTGLGPPVLFLASVVGLAIPWIMRRSGSAGRPHDHGHSAANACLRALGAGTVLGIALLHCLPEAAEALGCARLTSGDYPWAFLIAAAAAAASALLEGVLVEVMGGGGGAGASAPTTRACGAKAVPLHANTGRPDSAHEPDAEAGTVALGAAVAPHAPPPPPPLTAASMRSHSHGHPDSPPPSFHASAVAVLEVGIGLHSLVIGFALGAAPNACDALPLLAAFAVHQLLEGAAVGSCLADCSLGRRGVAASAAVMALTAPAGAVIGIVAARTSAALTHSQAGRVATGAADAVAAGLLLHVGLADLLASSGGVGLLGVSAPPTKVRQVAAHALFGASLVAGLGLASVLAVWG